MLSSHTLGFALTVPVTTIIIQLFLRNAGKGAVMLEMNTGIDLTGFGWLTNSNSLIVVRTVPDLKAIDLHSRG